MKRVSWPAELASLPLLQEHVETLAQQSGLGPKRLIQLSIALEEVVMNIINHAYAPAETGKISIGFEDQGDQVFISISDTGVAFNPLGMAAPDVKSNLMDRPIGGLGVMMVKKFMDKVAYEHCNNENTLHLTFNKTE